MKPKKQLIFLLVLILTFGSVLSACGTGNTNKPETAGSQEVVVNLGTEPPQMNSILTNDAISMNVMRATGEGLTRLDQHSRPIPGIAEKWDTSADGLTYTFHLRDAKWSDGTSVTAKDFDFAWKSVLKPENAAPYAYILYVIKGAQAYNEGTGKAEDVGVRVIDDRILEVTLEMFTPHFLDLCAFGLLLPVNQAFYEKQADGDKNLYGTEADRLLYNGPWTMKSWQHSDRIVLEKNPNYYNKENIKLDRITMLMVKNTDTAYTMFAAGELDMAGFNSSSQAEKARSDGYTTSRYSDGTTVYLEYNLMDSVLKNKNIRKALTYAIDREAHVTKVLKNSSVPALSFTNPDIKGLKGSFQSEVGPLFKDNDLQKAKELLQGGLRELGLEALPKLVFLTDDSDVGKTEAAAYQEVWRKGLGVEIEVQVMPFKSMIEKIMSKDYQISISLWGPDYNDPMTFLDLWESGNGNNSTSYASQEYDRLMDKIRTETDSAKRYDLLKQAEKLLMEDMPISPLYHRNKDYVVKPWFKDVVRNAFQDLDLYWAYVDSSLKK